METRFLDKDRLRPLLACLFLDKAPLFTSLPRALSRTEVDNFLLPLARMKEQMLFLEKPFVESKAFTACLTKAWSPNGLVAALAEGVQFSVEVGAVSVLFAFILVWLSTSNDLKKEMLMIPEDALVVLAL